MAEQETQKQDNGKVQKNFDKALADIHLIMGGHFLFKPLSMAPDDIKSAVQELAKEDKEEAIKEFKAEAKAIVSEKRKFDQELAKLEKEFNGKKVAAMKIFTERTEGLRKKVKTLEGLEKSWYDTLIGAATGITVSADPSDLPNEEEKED